MLWCDVRGTLSVSVCHRTFAANRYLGLQSQYLKCVKDCMDLFVYFGLLIGPREVERVIAIGMPAIKADHLLFL